MQKISSNHPKVLCVISSKVPKAICQLEAINKAVKTHGGEYGVVLPTTKSGLFIPEVFNLVAESYLGIEYYSDLSSEDKYHFTENFVVTSDDSKKFGEEYRQRKLKEAKMAGVEEPNIPVITLSYLQTCCYKFNTFLNEEYYKVDLIKDTNINDLKPYIYVSKKQKTEAINLLKKLGRETGQKVNNNTNFVILDVDSPELLESVGKNTFVFDRQDLRNLDSYEIYGLLSLNNCVGLISNSDLIHVAWALDKQLMVYLSDKNYDWLTPRSMTCMVWQKALDKSIPELTEIVKNEVDKWKK